VLLPSTQYVAYATLALGSALALFLYPHSLTGVLSSNSGKTVKRNAALLPLYSLLLGLLALLGFMAIAANVKLPAAYKANGAVPTLFAAVFPDWFQGFAFAANLFTRNVYKEYIRPDCTEREESRVAKLTSLVVKAGALLFILFVPATNVINFQLLGGIWIIQTLPAVFLGLYTSWFNRWALVIGWAAGMAVGTLMAISQSFASLYPLHFGGLNTTVYAALAAVIVNLVVTVVLTPIFQLARLRNGKDTTTPEDYKEMQPLPA
jgi:SSS family solute:Na+ symporter